MGISEVEIIGEDGEGDGGSEYEFGSADDGGSGRSSGSGSGNGPSRRWYQPANAPVLVSLVAVLLVAAGAAFAAVQRDRSGDDFGLTLISAQYTVRQDASGIDLQLALQNTGSTMVELTGAAVYQPGLVRLTQTGDGVGVTETEAGAATASALGPGTAIASLAITPKDVEVISVPFRYDCGISAFPSVDRAVSLAGFSARGTAHTARLTLPANVTPWEGGDVVRSALCDQPSVSTDLSIVYEGITSPPSLSRFTYQIELTAPTAARVTISSLAQDNPGIASSVDPAAPITVLNGQTVRLTVTGRVLNCIVATAAGSTVGVKITASAGQSVQTFDASLGPLFAKDLATAISTRCSGT